MSGDLNEVTKRLLAEGWTKDQTPPGMRPWNQWYGGWEYDRKTKYNQTYETPCGLLVKYSEVMTGLSFMGYTFTLENDLGFTHCPYWDKTDCEMNHEAFRNHRTPGCLYECVVHETDRTWNYEESTKRLHDLENQEAERKWEALKEQRKGRTCKNQAVYDRQRREWNTFYEPLECALLQCSYCDILQKKIDKTRFNVFYDLEITRSVKGVGLFEDKTVISIEKGKKLMPKPIPKTIAEIIAKNVAEIQRKEEMRHHRELFFNEIISLTVKNVRAEKREGRDLLQDLKDIEEGIQITHESDNIKQTKEAKKAKRQKAADDRVRKIEKLIAEKGFSNLEMADRRRAEKLLDQDRIDELDAMVTEQLSLF